MLNKTLLAVISSGAPAHSVGLPQLLWEYEYGISNSATSITVNMTQASVGDVAFVIIMSRNSVILPVGWTKEHTSDYTTFDQRLTVYRKVITSSDMGSLTIANESGDGRLDAKILGFSYTGTVPPFLVVGDSSSSATQSITNDNAVVLNSPGIPIVAVTLAYRSLSTITNISSTASINGGSMINLTSQDYAIVYQEGQFDNSGTRIWVGRKLTIAPQGYTINNCLIQSTNTDPQSLAMSIFNITCGLPTP